MFDVEFTLPQHSSDSSATHMMRSFWLAGGKTSGLFFNHCFCFYEYGRYYGNGSRRPILKPNLWISPHAPFVWDLLYVVEPLKYMLSDTSSSTGPHLVSLILEMNH